MVDDFQKDKYGVRFTLPDSMSDKDKLESLKNIISIMKTFADVAGEEPPELTQITEAIAGLEAKLTPKELKEDKMTGDGTMVGV